MANSRFLGALRKLTAVRQGRIKKTLTLWKKQGNQDGIDYAQIARNVEAETALSLPKFSKLLDRFSAHLEDGRPSIDAWKGACDDYQLAGPVLPGPLRPSHLGRATKLGDFSDQLERQFSDRTIRHALYKNADRSKPSAALIRHLHKANLGRGTIIWACFDQKSSDKPFVGLPLDTSSIRVALGLGCADSVSPFLLLTYEATSASEIPLHRPSVADAGTYSYFRPSSDPDAKWGLTHPLTP